MPNKLLILGIRGIPACHGGFETFAESFALFMQRQGWEVTVYCQEVGHAPVYTSDWKGIRRIHLFVKEDSAQGTVLFDYKSVRHATTQEGVVLTLGYNTALFSIFYRLCGKRNIINMDGVEWRRDKWCFYQRVWLYCNEWLGARLANHLIADHPEIKKHLQRHTRAKKITVIPYAAENITHAEVSLLEPFGLTSNGYGIVIARPEPENSILDIVMAFSKLSSKQALDFKLVVLGKFEAEKNTYHRQVLEAASDNVLFVGAIYQSNIVQALRYHARVYIHGHTVGGTNPSLIESMGAGNAIVAHGNAFNRWVIGEGGIYFEDEASLDRALLKCMDDDLLVSHSKVVKQRYLATFRFDMIHHAYLKQIERESKA